MKAEPRRWRVPAAMIILLAAVWLVPLRCFADNSLEVSTRQGGKVIRAQGLFETSYIFGKPFENDAKVAEDVNLFRLEINRKIYHLVKEYPGAEKIYLTLMIPDSETERGKKTRAEEGFKCLIDDHGIKFVRQFPNEISFVSQCRLADYMSLEKQVLLNRNLLGPDSGKDRREIWNRYRLSWQMDEF
ncbi:MAG: hypothetical protein HQK59_00525 [Deltaproteobacteria bacterium]|nr:hypothetical protein [Deltaproteobacteria bacterium]